MIFIFLTPSWTPWKHGAYLVSFASQSLALCLHELMLSEYSLSCNELISLWSGKQQSSQSGAYRSALKSSPTWSLPRGHSGTESACQCKRHGRCSFDSWVGRIPWSRKWQPAPVVLLGASYGQRGLAGHRARVPRRRTRPSGQACARASGQGIGVEILWSVNTACSLSVCVGHLVASSSLWPQDLSMDFSRQESWRGLPFPSPTCPLSVSQCAAPTNWDEVKGSTTFRKMRMYSLQYRVLEMDHIFPCAYPTSNIAVGRKMFSMRTML